MNTIVNKLLEVDREARRMLDEAQQYRERTVQETKREKRRVLDELDTRAARHIQELREEQETEVQEAVAAVGMRTEAVRSAMKAQYDRSHSQWEDTLYRMVTGD